MGSQHLVPDYLRELPEQGNEVFFLPGYIHTIERLTAVRLQKPIRYREGNYGHSSKLVYEIQIGEAGKVGVVLDSDELTSFNPAEYFKRKAETIQFQGRISTEDEHVGLGILEGLYGESLDFRLSALSGAAVPKKLASDMWSEVGDKLIEMRQNGQLHEYGRSLGRNIQISGGVAWGKIYITDFYASPYYPTDNLFVPADRHRIYIYSKINFDEFPLEILTHMHQFLQGGSESTALFIWLGDSLGKWPANCKVDLMAFLSAKGKDCKDLGILALGSIEELEKEPVD